MYYTQAYNFLSLHKIISLYKDGSTANIPHWE